MQANSIKVYLVLCGNGVQANSIKCIWSCVGTECRLTQLSVSGPVWERSAGNSIKCIWSCVGTECRLTQLKCIWSCVGTECRLTQLKCIWSCVGTECRLTQLSVSGPVWERSAG